MNQAVREQINQLRVLNVVRSRRYKALFHGDNGEIRDEGRRVLGDLARFCKVDEATIFSTDAMELARREGRREVYVRIQRMLNLDEDYVAKLMMETENEYE